MHSPRFSGRRPVRLSSFVAAGTLVAALAATAASALETPIGKPQKQAGMEVAAVELAPFGIRVNLVTPGATDTEFFDRAGMMDTKVGQQEKDDPADVAHAGFDAMNNGEGDVVSGWKNKLQTAMADVTPPSLLAEQHRKMAEPGSAEKKQ